MALALRPGMDRLPTDDMYTNLLGASRRGTPRLEVEAVISGHLAQGNLRVILRDLSFGGFSVESPLGFSPGTCHEFRFITGEGLLVTVLAEAVYSREVGMRDGMAYWLSGFKYILETEQAERAVEILIDAAISPLSFH
jgi:hypothetical protein